MKRSLLTLLFALLVGVVVGQDLRIKAASNYFEQNRYADALPIYTELCLKDKISIEKYPTVYRNAIVASMTCSQHQLAYEFTLKAFAILNPNEVYNFWKLVMFLGKYDEASAVLNDQRLLELSPEKKERLKMYSESTILNYSVADSSENKIKELKINSNKGDFCPIIHPDGLVFSSKRDQSLTVSPLNDSHYISQFLYKEDMNSITRLNSIKNKYHDGVTCYDSIRKVWYYTANVKKDKEQSITKTGIFIYDERTKTETSFLYNNPSYFIGHPSLSLDGKTLYFSSDMPGGFGGADIWVSYLEDNVWSKPLNLGAIINTDENEMFPYIHNDVLYFSSEGHLGFGGLDVYKSNLKNENFVTVEHISFPFNSFGDDFGIALHEEGKSGYYTNNRSTNQYIDKLFEFQFFDKKVYYSAKLVNALDDEFVLEGIQVLVKDENGNIIDSLKSNSNGEVNFEMKPDNKYVFAINDSEFEAYIDNVSTYDIAHNDTVTSRINLQPLYVQYNSLCLNEETRESLSDVNVKVKNIKTKDVFEIKSDANGIVATQLKRGEEFELIYSIKGFVEQKVMLSPTKNEKDIQNEITLNQMKAVTKFTIENVFYDFAKATLREENKAELDKLATFLLQNDNIRIELSSHTDSRGSDAHNQKLSQARAQSCVDYLLTKGVAKENIVAKGYGETMLVNRCKNGVKCSEEEHQVNRRTEIKVLSVK